MSTVKGFYDKERNIIPYDYRYLANSPTKLSNFTNDLFGEQREVVQEITKDSFVYDEVLQAYTFFIDSALTWLVVDENVSKVLGCDLLRYNSEASAYELVTEETSPFVVGSDKVITFENFRLFNGLRPSATGEYAEVDEFWVVCDNIDFGDEGYFSISHKYTKGLSNMEQVSSFVKVTIPNGRMRGDVDGDGKITLDDSDLMKNGTGSAGVGYYLKNLSTIFPDGNIPLDYSAADVDNNGLINSDDYNYIYSIMNGVNKAGAYAEITGNWTNNPNYATEEGQFYTDIPITGMTTNHSASVIVKGTFENGFFPKAECVEGAIRIYAKLCPISALTAVVSWGSGNGTAVITTESEDLTAYAEHVSNADIHVTADEKTAWNTSDVFVAIYETTTNSEIESAYQSGKAVFCKKGSYLFVFVSRLDENTHVFSSVDTASSSIAVCSSNTWSVDYTDLPPKIGDTDIGKVLSVDKNGSSIWKDIKPTITTVSLLASNWDSMAKTYSFETDYPSASYDIEIALDSTATLEQAEAFNGAQIVGSATSNTIKAYGEVPTVDIPIIIKVVTK